MCGWSCSVAKVERMKQAKSEAAAVVEKYKAEKEAEFKKKTSSSSLNAENAAMTAETDREIAQMKMDFEKNKDVSEAQCKCKK